MADSDKFGNNLEKLVDAFAGTGTLSIVSKKSPRRRVRLRESIMQQSKCPDKGAKFKRPADVALIAVTFGEIRTQYSIKMHNQPAHLNQEGSFCIICK
jgi:hypothetical protein